MTLATSVPKYSSRASLSASSSSDRRTVISFFLSFGGMSLIMHTLQVKRKKFIDLLKISWHIHQHLLYV